MSPLLERALASGFSSAFCTSGSRSASSSGTTGNYGAEERVENKVRRSFAFFWRHLFDF